MKSIPKPGAILPNHNLKLITQIGKGGMGLVFKAEEQTTGRLVAVKFVIPPNTCDNEADAAAQQDRIHQRFRDEIKAAARINCPHIVTFHYAGNDENYGPYAVFELVEKGSLAQEIKSNGALRWNRAIKEVAIPLSSALKTLHKAGIIHRDIKPDNLLHGDECYKLGDFGISLFEEREAVTRTCEGALGTPGYIAPERLTRPNESGTEASDVYSAALVIIKASSGRLPFTAPETSGAMLVAEQVKSTITPQAIGRLGIPAVSVRRFPSETARTILARAISTNPLERPSMDELLAFFKAAEKTAAAVAASSEEGDKTKVRDSDESASLRNRALKMEADKLKNDELGAKHRQDEKQEHIILDSKRPVQSSAALTLESQPMDRMASNRPVRKQGAGGLKGSENVTEERPVRGNAGGNKASKSLAAKNASNSASGKRISLKAQPRNWRKIIPAAFLLIFLLGGLGYVAQNLFTPPPGEPWKIVDQRAADALKQTKATFSDDMAQNQKLYEAMPENIIKWMQSIETLMVAVEEHKYNLRDTDFEVKKKEIQTYLGQSSLKDFIKAEFFSSKGQGIKAANAYRDSTSQLLQDMFLKREGLRKENPVAEYVLKKIVDTLGQNEKTKAGKKTKTGKGGKSHSSSGGKSFARCLTKEENDDWFHFRMILPAKEFLDEDAYFIQCWQFISTAMTLGKEKTEQGDDQRVHYKVMKPALGYLVHHERTRRLEAGNIKFLEDLFGSERKNVPKKEEIIKGQEPHVRLREIWEGAKKAKLHKNLLISKPIAINTLGHLNDNVEFSKGYDAFWRNYWLLVGDMIAEPEFDDKRCGTFFWVFEKNASQSNKQISNYFYAAQLARIKLMLFQNTQTNLNQRKDVSTQMQWHLLLGTWNVFDTQKYPMASSFKQYWKFLNLGPNSYYKDLVSSCIATLESNFNNSLGFAIKALNSTTYTGTPSTSYWETLLQLRQIQIGIYLLSTAAIKTWPEKQNLDSLSNLPNTISMTTDKLSGFSKHRSSSVIMELKLLNESMKIWSFICMLYEKTATQDTIHQFEKSISSETAKVLSSSLKQLHAISPHTIKYERGRNGQPTKPN